MLIWLFEFHQRFSFRKPANSCNISPILLKSPESLLCKQHWSLFVSIGLQASCIMEKDLRNLLGFALKSDSYSL